MLVMNMVNDSTSTFALLLWEGGIVATAAPNMMGDYCSFLQWSTAAHMGTKASVYSTFELYNVYVYGGKIRVKFLFNIC